MSLVTIYKTGAAYLNYSVIHLLTFMWNEMASQRGALCEIASHLAAVELLSVIKITEVNNIIPMLLVMTMYGCTPDGL